MSRKQIDRLAKLHIIDALRDKLDAYEYDNAYSMTNKEVAQAGAQIFADEYQWRVDQVGPQNAVTDWLQGLAINIEYRNHAILEMAREWGSISPDATERQEDSILDNYWQFMAAKTLQVFNGYRVPEEMEAA